MAKAREGEEFAMVTVDTHHSAYVEAGATTDATPDMALEKLLFVMDRDGWATLHRVLGFGYRGGKRRVMFGPRIPWPDGSVAARHTSTYASG